MMRQFARPLSTQRALIATTLCERSGVLTFAFNNEKKLNALTMPMIDELCQTLADVAHKDEVKGVVVTGKGKYYSAGADLSSTLTPMAPSKLVVAIRDKNQRCA